MIAGSIEDGQDPAFTTVVDRQLRSGSARRGDVTAFFVNGTCSSWIRAYQQAVQTGIDILNVSAWISCIPGGEPECDCGGMNTAIANAAFSGVLPVHGVGNGGDPGGPGTPSMNYPATRRDGVAVGAYDSSSELINGDTSGVAPFSARGGVDVRLWTGGTVADAMAGVDLLAPGHRDFTYSSLSSYGGGVAGTSYAAPAVAGCAGLMREHLNITNWFGGANDARALMVNVLLWGDAFAFDQGADSNEGFDPRSGAGRTHVAFPSSSDLTSPWGWGWHKFTIGNSQEVCFNVGGSGPESTSVTQWKAVMTWYESSYAMIGDIVLDVWNTCPAGGGNRVKVIDDWSFDMRKRVELQASSIGGRCLQYCARTFSNSLPAPRTVYVADYYHSGNPGDH